MDCKNCTYYSKTQEISTSFNVVQHPVLLEEEIRNIGGINKNETAQKLFLSFKLENCNCSLIFNKIFDNITILVTDLYVLLSNPSYIASKTSDRNLDMELFRTRKLLSKFKKLKLKILIDIAALKRCIFVYSCCYFL